MSPVDVQAEPADAPLGARLPSERVRVLYFAGSGRSGTTVINNILGQVDGAFAAGELRFLWQRGVVDDKLCGCGAPFSECELWSQVLEDAFPDGSLPDAQAIAGGLGSRLRILKVPAMVLRRAIGRRPVPAHPHDGAIAELYAALARHTGDVVILDSSKLPPYGLLLSTMPQIDLYVLHVVRDPRATAFSWRRTKKSLDYKGDADELMPQLRLWKSSILWAGWNALTGVLWSRGSDRYLRLRYEDFVQRPQQTMAEVVRMVGLDAASLPFETATSVRLSRTHSVAGNPARHATGPVELSIDNEWLTAMTGTQRRVVTFLTAPVLRAFGYPVRASRARASTSTSATTST